MLHRETTADPDLDCLGRALGSAGGSRPGGVAAADSVALPDDGLWFLARVGNSLLTDGVLYVK